LPKSIRASFELTIRVCILALHTCSVFWDGGVHPTQHLKAGIKGKPPIVDGELDKLVRLFTVPCRLPACCVAVNALLARVRPTNMI